MNYICFIAGLSIGAFVTTLAYLVMISTLYKGTAKMTNDANTTTADLMRTRNDLDRQKIEVMDRIANIMVERLK